jgi:hypothetical protein
LVNGISQGKGDKRGNGIFIWKSVTLSPGDNKISARARSGGRVLTDECVWNLR